MRALIAATALIILLFAVSVAHPMSSGGKHDVAPPDTLVLHPIDFSTPSPEGWQAQYTATVRFPEAVKSSDDQKTPQWAKIIMVQTLKCDSATKGDKYDCGEWDYIWDAMINVAEGDSVEVFKLGSFITPYGKRLKMGGEKGWQWLYDLTDYAPLLKGDVELTIGNNQELLDLKFLLISGTPERQVLSVQNVFPPGKKDGHYGALYTYGDLDDDIALKETAITLDENAAGFKLKAIISGHGHEGPDNCCEWTDKEHGYLINGNPAFSWRIWKDCGENPIYPQGGTWPYDRAGWCPGTPVDEYSFELTELVSPGETILVDYQIEPMTDETEGPGIYRMAHQLFTYGPPNFRYNATVKSIINPSSADKYSRINPTLFDPRVVVSNGGSEPIEEVTFRYGLVAGRPASLVWRGKLKFGEEAEVTLPVPDWTGLSTDQVFFVEIMEINGKSDENPWDSLVHSRVPIPDEMPESFVLRLHTNNLGRASENTYTLVNSAGEVVLQGANLEDDTEYNTRLDLEAGVYEFLLIDSSEDGIDRLWWQSDPDSVGIRGELEFLGTDGRILMEFPPDFGPGIRYQFLVGKKP